MNYRQLTGTAPAILLTGCSATQLAYRNLDWAISWWVDDYIDLNSRQQAQLDEALERHLQWHCEAELPRYVDWLNQLYLMSYQQPPEREAIRERFREFRGALDRLLKEITPSTVALLATITPQQRQALARTLAEKNRELASEMLPETPEARIDARAERMRERVAGWLGSLTPEQETRIMEWSRARQGMTRAWLENRKRWQKAFLEALETPGGRSFRETITELLQNRETTWTASYRQTQDRSIEAALDLVHALFATATDAQRQYFRTQVDALREDFKALRC